MFKIDEASEVFAKRMEGITENKKYFELNRKLKREANYYLKKIEHTPTLI